MPIVRVHNFAVSLDGFGTGEGQSLEAPFGHAGSRLLEGFLATRSFQAIHGGTGGTLGVDEAFASNWATGIGAEIMGRNKFGPQRGPWTDEEWKGWWGDDPVFQCDVFVLTHHPRKSFEMKGGTVFHFVTDGIESALQKAKAAAKGKDVRIGGGVSTLKQYLAARAIDEMHIAVSPVLLGRGENLWDGIDLLALGYERKQYVPTEAATHYVFGRR